MPTSREKQLFSQYIIEDFFSQVMQRLRSEIAKLDAAHLAECDREELYKKLEDKYTLKFPVLSNTISDPEFDEHNPVVRFYVPFEGDKRFFESYSSNWVTNEPKPYGVVENNRLVLEFSTSTKPIIDPRGFEIMRSPGSIPTPENVKRWPHDKLANLNKWLTQYRNNAQKCNSIITQNIRSEVEKKVREYQVIKKQQDDLKKAFGITTNTTQPSKPFDVGSGVVPRVTAESKSASTSQKSALSKQREKHTMPANPKKVFVIHGRNEALRKSMFDFLRSIGLEPIEWSQAVKLTGKASPYIGETLEAAFNEAQAVVALLTGDDEAKLRNELLNDHDDDNEKQLTPQARPNVIFELGMAFSRHSERTIIVEIGKLRPFSDVIGRHAVRLNNTTQKRQDLAERLETSGCKVDISGRDWHTTGNFNIQNP